MVAAKSSRVIPLNERSTLLKKPDRTAHPPFASGLIAAMDYAPGAGTLLRLGAMRCLDIDLI
jgi:hypothetical protein